MKFARRASIGLALAAACVFVGCGDGGDAAAPSQSELDSAQAASKSVQQMGPPPVVGKKTGRRN